MVFLWDTIDMRLKQKCYLSLVMNADSIYVQLYGLNLSTVLQDILTLHMFQHNHITSQFICILDHIRTFLDHNFAGSVLVKHPLTIITYFERLLGNNPFLL